MINCKFFGHLNIENRETKIVVKLKRELNAQLLCDSDNSIC